MTTESNEQYRAGFEAHCRAIGKDAHDLRRSTAHDRVITGDDYVWGDINQRWESWCAAMQQREASTEPSEVERLALELQNQRELVQHWKAKANYGASTEPSRPPGAQPCHLCEGQGFINQCVICGSAEPRTGTCGSDDPRALCNWNAGAGALPDEAIDAARYRFLRAAKWFKEGFAKTEPQASAFHYVGELLDSKIDAAIEAHNRTGSGKGEEK
jgi:hypothetical protein